MRLVSMLTENYVPRAESFLYSLPRLSLIKRSVVCLGFNIDPVPWGGVYIDFPSMPRHWSESSCGIMQHGIWLEALPDASDDELYLLSDADIVIQRDFIPKERQRLESYSERVFGATWNAGAGDNLLAEAGRIGLANDGTFGSESSWGSISCFNTGILVMRGIAWKRLRDLYLSRCVHFYKLTQHRSRGQWLICWCLDRLGLQADILPAEIHSHAHFGIPSGVALRDGIAYYLDDVVLFRHAF